MKSLPSQLTVHALGRSGDGVAKDSAGVTWFVPGGIVGDVVAVEKGRSPRAEKWRLLTPSPDRVPSYCSTVRCSGCALRECRPDAQNEQMRIELARLLKLPASELRPTLSGPALGYRHRVRLTVRGHSVGYREAASQQPVDIKQCPVLIPEFEKKLLHFVGAVKREGDMHGEVEVVYSTATGGISIEYISGGDEPAGQAHERVRSWLAGRLIAGAVVEDRRGQRRQYADYTVHLHHPECKQGKTFDFEPGVFSQANQELNTAFVEAVGAAVPAKARVLELHAGAGNLTLRAAAGSAAYVATEWDERAVVWLRRNIETAQLAHASVHVMSDVDAAAKFARESDVVLMDPPRTGAGAACAALLESGVKRIVYVSCDAKSFAADWLILSIGYALTSVQPVAMFPGTPHGELIAVLDRLP